MSTKSRFLALTAMFSILLISSVNAGVLDGNPLAFNNGAGPSGGAWTGSDVYDNGLVGTGFHLIGNLDFAVFTVADFDTAFPGVLNVPVTGYTPDPGDSLIYAYQIENQGDFAVSAQIVGISSVANAIGSFVNASGEVAPSAQVFDSGGNAIWFYSAPNIATGEDSYIMAFSSQNIPQLGTGIGTTVDGGTVGITSVPTPSSIAIPEPASFVLLVAGLLGSFACSRRR